MDEEGNNQIYLLPGINNNFNPQDVDDAAPLFEEATKSTGIVALSLELPLNTALYILDKAKEYGLKVVLDPGGIQEGVDYKPLLNKDIFLLKPNEHEAEILSGVKVSDLESARQAAKVLMDFGVKTYLSPRELGAHISSRNLPWSTFQFSKSKLIYQRRTKRVAAIKRWRPPARFSRKERVSWKRRELELSRELCSFINQASHRSQEKNF